MDEVKTLEVNNLILEVTRRCNMKCVHCLRGDAEDLDMPETIVDRTLGDITGIDKIVFSGGEPFLNLHIIRYTLEQVKKRHIPVRGVYLATNAKEVKDEYLQMMDDWVFYIAGCLYKVDEMLGSDAYMPMTNEEFSDYLNYSAVSVSRDIYHENIPTENYLKWRLKSYYSAIKEHGNEEYFLVNEGRAYENGIGERHFDIPFEIEKDDNGYMFVDSLYVSANGNIVANCDLSYDSIDEKPVGNISEESLRAILEREAENG